MSYYLKSQNALTTRYDSGWIDREGNFYGTEFAKHRHLALKLCRKFKIKRDRLPKYGGLPEEWDLCEKAIERAGFVKICRYHFYWNEETTPTEAQQKTIADFMINNKMKVASFNKFWNSDRPKTLEEALKKTVNIDVL